MNETKDLCERNIKELAFLMDEYRVLRKQADAFPLNELEKKELLKIEREYNTAIYSAQCELRDLLRLLNKEPENRFFVLRMTKELDLMMKKDK